MITDPFEGVAPGATATTPPAPALRRIREGSPQQEAFWDELIKGSSSVLLEARAGTGKCLGRGTPVLMYDGTVVPVESVIVGDRLMGPDSRPRTVLSISSGHGPLICVIPVKGSPWTCNDAHVLSLRDSVTKQDFDIDIKEYMANSFRVRLRDAKLFRTGVMFPEQETALDPYLVGLWIGDGTVGEPRLTNPDPEILEYVEAEAVSLGLSAASWMNSGVNPCPTIGIVMPGGKGYLAGRYGKRPSNPVRDEVRRCFVAGEKRIPREYLVNSGWKQLRLLAGIIDTDGYLSGKGYEIITKYDGLKDDILFLARSLSFAAYASVKVGTIKSLGFTGQYWRIMISGHTDSIPCRVSRKKAGPRRQKKDVRMTGFGLEPCGDGDYHGFTLDGDGRFLLGDFTVTHNSSSAREGMHRIMDYCGHSGQGNPRQIYCCFNKAIADEFRVGCPPGVEVATMHSIGARMLKRAFGSQIRDDKTYMILDQIGAADEPRWLRKAIASVVSLAKNRGLIPDFRGAEARDEVCATEGNLAGLILNYGIECYRRMDDVISWAYKVMPKVREKTDTIDFDDMLWLPVLWGLDAPSCDILFIDEAQDLNSIQHDFAEVIAGGGRTVIIGDPKQAIYAWRGADMNSIQTLKENLDAKTLPLTVTWRCPRSHVELARQLVPDFEAAPNAPEGVLIRKGEEIERDPDETWEEFLERQADARADVVSNAEPGTLVLCRANAPIVKACLQAISERRPAIVRGRAIGDELQGIVRGIRDAETCGRFAREVERWRGDKLEKLADRDGADQAIERVNDQADCLAALADACDSPAEIPGLISALFTDARDGDKVTFSSVHRSKGSEAQRVVYIQVPYTEARDRERKVPEWEHQQRKNLRYVALTRSKHSLVLTQ